MNITEISKHLDQINTGQSDFEFENFFIETFPTRARQLVAVMLEIEDLHSQITAAELSGNTQITVRKLTQLKQKLNRLYNWYESIPAKERTEILKNYENEESAYWTNVLGRQAAIEVLTDQKTSAETMNNMSNLPVDEFEEAVRICSKYTALIQDTTESVENSLANNITGIPQE